MYHCKNRTFSWWLVVEPPISFQQKHQIESFLPAFRVAKNKKKLLKPTPGGAICSLLASLETLCLQRCRDPISKKK